MKLKTIKESRKSLLLGLRYITTWWMTTSTDEARALVDLARGRGPQEKTSRPETFQLRKYIN
jgi:hypothetical protein